MMPALPLPGQRPLPCLLLKREYRSVGEVTAHCMLPHNTIYATDTIYATAHRRAGAAAALGLGEAQELATLLQQVCARLLANS